MKTPMLLVLLALALWLSSCGGQDFIPSNSKPTTYLASPPHGSQFGENETVRVQSMSTDTAGISRVELMVDGALIRADSPSDPQGTYSISQDWTARAGTHTLAVRAYNTRAVASDMAAVNVTVLPAAQLSAPPTLALTAQASQTPAPTVIRSTPTFVPSSTRAPSASPTRPRATLPARLQEDTTFEGKKDYICDARGCWRTDGTLNKTWDYMFPNPDADNADIRALLDSIGLPATPASDDAVKWQRARTVWAWLNKNIIRESRPEREPAWNYLLQLTNTPSEHWPSIGELALIFKQHKGLVWGACNSRALMFATLLYRFGIPRDDMAVAVAQWKPVYSQHVYVTLHLQDGWFYLDPTCNESHAALSAAPENVGCMPTDYVHPNEIISLPRSTLTKPMLVR